MSADRPSSAIRETDNPPPAPPPPTQDKPAPSPRDTRTTAEYNRDAIARPPIQRHRDSSQAASRPGTGSQAGDGRAADRARGGDSAPAAPHDKPAAHGMVSDLEHNRAVLARPPMQRRDNSSPASTMQRPGSTSRAGAGNDGGSTHDSGADAGTNRGAERTGTSPDRPQPEQQRNAEPGGTSGHLAAQGARHDHAGESAASREHGGQAQAAVTQTGQELHDPRGGAQKGADGRAAVPEAEAEGGGDDGRHGLRASGAHDQAAAGPDDGQADAQDGMTGQAAAPDSSGQAASTDSAPATDGITLDAIAPTTAEPGAFPPDRADGSIDPGDHPDNPTGKPDSGLADSEVDRQVLVGALARLERKDQEIDQLRTERDQAKAEIDRLKGELDRLKAKETPPEDREPRDKQATEQPESANAGEPASGFASRVKPEHGDLGQVPDQGDPLRKRFQLPSDKALGVILTANTAADFFAANAHLISTPVATGLGAVAGLGAAVVMWGRERWENRRKNGH